MEQTNQIPGKVLISGTGFLVTGGMWALLGFFRYEDGHMDLATINSALVVAHLIIGVAILMRMRWSWYAGITLALAGIIASFFNEYYLPLVGDGVTGILLFLTRNELLNGSAPKVESDL